MLKSEIHLFSRVKKLHTYRRARHETRRRWPPTQATEGSDTETELIKNIRKSASIVSLIILTLPLCVIGNKIMTCFQTLHGSSIVWSLMYPSISSHETRSPIGCIVSCFVRSYGVILSTRAYRERIISFPGEVKRSTNEWLKTRHLELSELSPNSKTSPLYHWKRRKLIAKLIKLKFTYKVKCEFSKVDELRGTFFIKRNIEKSMSSDGRLNWKLRIVALDTHILLHIERAYKKIDEIIKLVHRGRSWHLELLFDKIRFEN